MRLSVVTFVVVMLTAASAVAQEPERGFFDLYYGMTKLFESDVTNWKFEDERGVAGLRAGMWLNDTNTLALTLRTWYFQTDAKEQRSGPSDLAFLGVSLELLMRWKMSERWAIYGTLGPMMAVTTLDVSPVLTGTQEDSRDLAPGATASVGVEVGVFWRLRAFAEMQGSLVYPSFDFSDRSIGRISPRFLNLYGLAGLRLPF
jgi:hypothetical protein